MAVVIRMKRSGRKNRPCYRISVADSRAPRDGRTLEALGLYDPIALKEEMQLKLDVERARYWLEQGAQPKVKRDRSGRKKATATRARRKSDKAARSSAKTARLEARRKAAAEARKAAAAATESEA
jgi:small subunit ribosomal protein S16